MSSQIAVCGYIFTGILRTLTSQEAIISYANGGSLITSKNVHNADEILMKVLDFNNEDISAVKDYFDTPAFCKVEVEGMVYVFHVPLCLYPLSIITHSS